MQKSDVLEMIGFNGPPSKAQTSQQRVRCLSFSNIQADLRVVIESVSGHDGVVRKRILGFGSNGRQIIDAVVPNDVEIFDEMCHVSGRFRISRGHE